MKFLQRLDQNVEYKRPAGAYPLHDFHKICRICTPFQDTSAVKILLDLLKGLWSYAGFKLMESLWLPRNFQRPLVAKRFTGARTCSGPLSPCQVWWGSDFTCRGGSQKR